MGKVIYHTINQLKLYPLVCLSLSNFVNFPIWNTEIICSDFKLRSQLRNYSLDHAAFWHQLRPGYDRSQSHFKYLQS